MAEWIGWTIGVSAACLYFVMAVCCAEIYVRRDPTAEGEEIFVAVFWWITLLFWLGVWLAHKVERKN